MHFLYVIAMDLQFFKEALQFTCRPLADKPRKTLRAILVDFQTRFDDDSDTVPISRIIVGRQDYMRILFSEMDFAMDEIKSEKRKPRSSKQIL